MRLDSNPSTGYSWEVTDNDEVILRQLGDSVFRAKLRLSEQGGLRPSDSRR